MAETRDDDATREMPDPLGLGGTPPPGAPSRHPRPKVLSLLGEFFKMSRTTAVLLTAFVLASVVYLLVREDPVVGFAPTPPSSPAAPSAPSEPATPVTPQTSPSPSNEATATTAPTTSAPATTLDDTDTTAVPTTPGRQSTTSVRPGEPTTARPPLEQQPQQVPQQETQPQGQAQRAPTEDGAVTVPDAGPVAG